MRRQTKVTLFLLATAGSSLLAGCASTGKAVADRGLTRAVTIPSNRSKPARSMPVASDKGIATVHDGIDQDDALQDAGVLDASVHSDADHDDADVKHATWASPSGGPVAETTDTQSAPADATVLTLDELLQIAADSNPTLQQAYALIHQAQGNWAQVGLYPNPTIEWHDEANNAPFDAHYGIVSQDIVTAKKLQLNREVATRDVQRAQWEAEAQSLRVLNEVRIRYIAALGAQRQVAVSEELLKIADDGVRVSRKFFEAEQVPQADVLQATLQQRQTQILARNARYRATAAWKELGNVIGRPNLPQKTLAGNLEDEAPEIEWETAWQDVINRNPALHAARSRAAAAQAQICREEVEPIPNLRVSGGSGPDVLPANQGFQMFFITVGAEVPVWNRNEGNIAAAVGNYQAAEAEVMRLELALQDDLARAFQRYQSARNEVEMYRDPILPTAEKNLDLTLKAYDAGEFDFLRVLIARRDLFQARINYVFSLTELRTAAAEIQGLLLTGGLDAVSNNPTASNSAGQTADPGR